MQMDDTAPILVSDGMPIALVTGANRGLGRETSRQLAARGVRVLLTARDVEDARATAAELAREGGVVDPHPLDVEDPASIDALVARVRELHGRIDVLVNNAGIALKGFDARIARKTIDVNFYGAMRVTDRFRPLEPRVIVMVSSGLGELSSLGAELRNAFASPSLSRARLVELVEQFVHEVEAGVHAVHGWPSSAYRVSKIALNALVRILARELGEHGARVNAVCPGWVRTELGGPAADRNVEEGARGIVWAATLPPEGPTGGFFRDQRLLDW
jgi:NAD(P)-dependent dehydrogenase (short-subunit alcohol dehydrogenase family)